MRRLTLIVLAMALCGAFSQSAFAGTAAPAAKVAFDGGTPAEQATVRSALAASSFNWSLLPVPIDVHIGAYGSSYSTQGNVYVDGSLLDSGTFSWGVVQHEFGHQVDFFLLDDAKRAILQQQLGGVDWCYTTPGLAHGQHGCERFASELAWAYWQSPSNAMQPADCSNESAGMPVAAFRALLTQLLGVPTTTSTIAATTRAFAPATTAAPKPKLKKK
jgi:hypothetical protein